MMPALLRRPRAKLYRRLREGNDGRRKGYAEELLSLAAMSEPLIRFEVREKYLFVVGLGKRDNLLQMTEAAGRIVKTAIEYNRRLMLVDYRKLEIDVSMSDAFNIVRGYEAHQPDLKNIIVAAVFDKNENLKGWQFGQFWKTVGDQRGFHIEIFEDIDAAEQWLLTQASS